MTDVFAGPSEMHRRVSRLDWASTPIGPIERWPQSLKATIKTLLGSRYPMIILWGPELIQIYNEVYIGLIGDKHPDALGRSIRETQAESWEVIGPMIHEVMSTGVPNWVPAAMLPLDRAGYREETYFSLSYSAVEDDDGRITGMLCVCSEVTQQVIGERRLRLLRDLSLRAGETRSVAQTCRDVAAAMSTHPLDLPFALLYVHDPATRALTLAGAAGLPEGEGPAPRRIDLGDGGDESDGGTWPMHRAMQGERVLVEDLAARFALGGGHWADAIRAALVMPIASAGKEAPHGVLVAGVSPNCALDDGYVSFYELLASQVSVAVRNARAYQEERQRAERLAEIDRAKTVFFNNVSHEFRTPLTLILGPVEDARAQTPRRLDGESLEAVHRSTLRLLKLVNSLLDFARIEAGRLQVSFEATDLAALTADLASSFRSLVERAGMRLVVDCPPLPEPVYVDRWHWERVVLNLLSNAFKFTLQGEITVRLTWEGDHAELSVRDTGIGIPERELPRVFDRFHRVQGAQGRSFEGTGIGLALVRELVKLHGGSIRVESRDGEGSTFVVSVPTGTAHLPQDRLAQGRELTPGKASGSPYVLEAHQWLADGPPPDAIADSPAAVDAAQPSPEEGGRILVVDDNADMRDYLVRLLRSRFEVEVAEDGQAALAAARARPPDVVLSDVMMPGLDGFALVRALRARTETTMVPVVLLSARAGEEAVVEGLETGADDYLVKPFSARELLARVRTVLQMARARRAAAEAGERERSEAALRAQAEAAAAENARLYEEARKAVRARDEFLSIASHELRTPLTPLQLQIRTLQRKLPRMELDGQSEVLASGLRGLQRQAERLSRLVEELLDVSRITRERVHLSLEPVNLSELVAEVLSRFEESGQVAAARSRFDVRAESEVTGRWDRNRIDQVLTNLVENALKFGAGKPVGIALVRDGSMASLTVTDHGIGISSDDHERIFGRFERAVSERHFGGLGLGLWIVRQIVDAMGGSIEVDSSPGCGATFRVRLPLAGAPMHPANEGGDAVTPRTPPG